MRTLERLGIEPLGAESVDSTVWVHYKEVDPYSVEEKQESSDYVPSSYAARDRSVGDAVYQLQD
jgi:hypothetical protein